MKTYIKLPAVVVTLDGSKSYDPVIGAPALTYSWTQTAGTAVTLSSTTVAAPTFSAPSTVGDLTFTLTVTGAQGTDSASVTVSVKTFIVTAPDTWFAGYGKLTTITPVVSGTTSSPAYLWTGLEAWLSTSSLTLLPLTFTTPTLSEFQNFPDRAGVLLMERTTQGRLQLKIKVTDGAESDEDYVNFSVGPFADSVANENVALGEPVFLNGGVTIPVPQPAPPAAAIPPANITSWTWSVKKPDGTAVALKTPDKAALAGLLQRYVYFVTDQVGTYKFQLIQSDGINIVVKDLDIECGTYVGVGSLTGTIPDPFKGECAACHAGQLPWLADFANPWKDTGHAHMLEKILDPTNPFYTASQAKGSWVDMFNFGSNFSIDSRSVGWSRISSKPNGGWAEMAATEGCVLTGTDWDELKRKHPKTAGKSNVQCESCHGPGSEHAGDSTAIRKSYDANVCGRCHADKQDRWELSGHGQTTSPAFTSASGSASCNGCHTAQGYVVEMRAQEGVDPHPALFAVGNINRPVLPLDDRRSVTCQACHEPHKKTVGRPAAPGYDPQLRAWGNVKFRNDVVAFAGEAAVCYTCHQSRTDTRANSADFNSRRAPHDSTAAEMLSGTNAYEFAGWTYNSSPHADRTRFVVPGNSETRRCLSCHNDVSPAKGQIGYNAIGGHTFKMSQGDGSTITDVAFGAGATTATTRIFRIPAPTAGATLLKRIYTGDSLELVGGSDGGTLLAPLTYMVDSVDSARQITLRAAGAFTAFVGTVPPTSWTLRSVPKYNVAACAVCHPTGTDFNFASRDDYDGNVSTSTIQEDIEGLKTALLAAIEAKASSLVGTTIAPTGVTFTPGSGRIKYTIPGSPAKVRTFPGPGVTSSDNPEISYAALSPADKASWDSLYQAGYDWVYVKNDGSDGIHNTGYAVNLLQSAYKAVTGLTLGTAFRPY
jgi:hypothetical protein